MGMKKRRRLEDVLCGGGECLDGEEISMLLEMSLKVLAAAANKRDACGLLAGPSRMRIPARAHRLREYLSHSGDG